MEVVKAKIKSAKSKDEFESLKFTQKNLIYKLVIFAEQSWTPSDLIQAEDFAHRIGQVSSVINIYYLLANDTVDDIIWDVVQFKLDNLGQ
ncbi:hypothetical protein S83_026867, partial [Arachis hypogaea]